uniref:mitochondrial import inner membrane translocase subunit Tim29-like n=1 Tax=Styela clava TaxID=7725 RepID=UPI001939E2C2|nr:mitochondrial import inner membrane translocase subunit Tim29-like [Styela clava]
MAALKVRGIGERLKTSLKTAIVDYRTSALESLQYMKENPVKTTMYTGLLLFGIRLNRTMPTETEFYAKLVDKSNEIVLLNDKTRNKESDEHIQKVSGYFAKGRIRHQNLVIFSLIYYTDYDVTNKHYESQCKFLRPKWREFHNRIVDIGLYRRWWVLRYHTTDYDINFEEFPKDLDSTWAQIKDFFNRILEISYFGNPAIPLSEQRKVRKAIEVVE